MVIGFKMKYDMILLHISYLGKLPILVPAVIVGVGKSYIAYFNYWSVTYIFVGQLRLVRIGSR